MKFDIHLIASLGFALTLFGYALRAYSGLPTYYIVAGMLMLTVGYTLLLVSAILEYRDTPENKHEVITYKNKKKEEDDSNIAIYGYTVLCLYFGLIQFFPQFTYNMRWYDLVGFFAAGFKIIPVAPIMLATSLWCIHYVFGALQKVKENEGVINKVQLVSRILLSIYYISTLVKEFHL